MKSRIYALFIGLLLTVTMTNSFATVIDNKPPKKDRIERRSDAKSKHVRIEQIKLRVNEIKDMDKSNLSMTEKKALKKELKDLKKEARATKGVYLSVGAIIIIILLLILIL
jgi:hypothetical protein